MKVAIGYHIQEGPWGGGNAFAKSLRDYIIAYGGSVVSSLQDRDIDIILLTDPRGFSPQISFHAGSVIRYLLTKNPSALVVHRINECDERKGTGSINRLLTYANHVADHTVFIASWLKDLKVWRRKSPHSIILNGADTTIFNSKGYVPWNGKQKLRLVTHHWGGNSQKGADIYSKFDELLGLSFWKERFSFSYIGNLPDGLQLSNSKVMPPMTANLLGKELVKSHVYLTGSINEPAGMHHIEGASCGLPIIYRQSGALPEYCDGFGLSFNNAAEFERALEEMLMKYKVFQKKMSTYPHNADIMCASYIDLFEKLIKKREKILQRRNLYSDPLALLRNQFPR